MSWITMHKGYRIRVQESDKDPSQWGAVVTDFTNEYFGYVVSNNPDEAEQGAKDLIDNMIDKQYKAINERLKELREGREGPIDPHGYRY